MRLAERTDYAMRVLIYLAATGQRQQVPEMAAVFDISENHLVKVVQLLTAAGFVKTTRGRNGGVELAQPAHAINLGDVARAIEPDFALVECFRDEGQCPLEDACRLRKVLDRAGRAFLNELDAVNVADLVRGRKTQLQDLGLAS